MPWKMHWDHWWLVWIARFLWGHTGFGLNLLYIQILPAKSGLKALPSWSGMVCKVHRFVGLHTFVSGSLQTTCCGLMYHIWHSVSFYNILHHIYNHIFVCGKRIWHSYYNDSIITRIVQCTAVRILTKAMFLISIIPLILAVLLILGSAAVALSKGWEARHHNPRLHSFLLDIRNVSIVVSLFWLLESLQSTTLRPSKSVGQSCPPAIAETVATLAWNFTPEWPIDSPSSRDRHWLDPKLRRSPSWANFREPKTIQLGHARLPQVSAKTPVTVRLCFGEVMMQAMDMPGEALIGAALENSLDAWDGWNRSWLTITRRSKVRDKVRCSSECFFKSDMEDQVQGWCHKNMNIPIRPIMFSDLT